MKHIDRPAQITTILKTIGAVADGEIRTELETYIADLEAKQPDRPGRITTILKDIETRYPADTRASLEEYITKLEANQQAVSSGDNHTSLYDPDNPPIWSHQRFMQREHHRRVRAFKKLNNYQQEEKRGTKLI